VVRHPLVQRIIRAYDARDEQRRSEEEGRGSVGRRMHAAAADFGASSGAGGASAPYADDEHTEE
jgi:hypothetical protein